MEFQWQLNTDYDFQEAFELAGVLNVPLSVSKLLCQRGITDFQTAKSFFRPELNQLHDPFLMEDMEIAIDRIAKALSKKEKIMVYGDYDVDGSTSVALMYSFLGQFSDKIQFYQPDRYEEGYGVSFQGIEKAREDGVQLIITLDCGVKAIDKVALAKEYGIDVIICDHHKPGKELPEAVAILNPKKDSCNYPYDELCGCGIGFKVIQGFVLHQGHSVEDVVPYLDLVAVAIGADIVPLTGENRVLAYFGLQQINASPRIGIKKLLEANNKSTNVTISDLVFTVAPRINAAGRISHAHSAVEMLLVDEEIAATQWCEKINQFNTDRKELDKDITAQALQMIAEDPFYETSKSTVVWDESWHKGVVGIVASRLIENSYKPTIVLAVGKDEATGSARSVKGFDVHDAIDACADYLTKYGGHKYAAGLSLKKENLSAFREAFDAYVSQNITAEQLIPKIKIDLVITPDDLMPETSGNPFPKLFRITESFAPFGPKNMHPVFLLRGLKDVGYSKAVGAENEHLKVSLKDESSGTVFNGIAFGMAPKLDILKEGEVDVVFSLAINEFMGSVELQLMIKDIKPAGEFAED